MPIILPIVLLVAGCATTDEDFDPTTFEAGTFQFTTTAVDDLCYDGAFSVIFMPEDIANDWATTTELPSWEGLPNTYEIELQDPFSAMDVTVEAGDDGEFILTGAEQNGIELDADNYPGCYVDMIIEASLGIVDADTVQGWASLNTASFDEASCPAVLSDPCDIDLDLTASRL